ncbi:MAG: hypothetical protein IT350_14230 [Deltaproteobacteria bacterium]|nr:hypothetical protein [Deltaproteobacteria bacterium]
MIFVAVSFAFSIWRVHSETGVLPEGISEHYSGKAGTLIGGEAAVPEPDTPAPSDDSAFPDDPALAGGGSALDFALTLREMVEITHVHLFVIPVVVYLVASLFLRTRAPGAAAVAIPAIAYVSIATDLSGMWLTRFVHDGFGTVIAVSGMALTASTAAMIATCLYELWFAKGGPR